MSANTETTGADRTKCKAWCGRLDQIPANGDWDGAPFQPDFRYWDPADGEVPSELVGKPMWRSSECRDARLPPIAAPELANCPANATGNPVDCGGCPDHAPPAQEAPKAAPVPSCMWRHATTPCAGPLAERHVGIAGSRESHGWCEGHMLEYDRQAAGRAGTGAPYAGPERLPRPQLAADWVEDCLPTVWR